MSLAECIEEPERIASVGSGSSGMVVFVFVYRTLEAQCVLVCVLCISCSEFCTYIYVWKVQG